MPSLTLTRPRFHFNAQEDTMRLTGCAILAFVLLVPVSAQNKGLPVGKPETVGFSSERLGRLNREMRRLVDDQEFAGIVTVAPR
jgi:hypothetical protein